MESTAFLPGMRVRRIADDALGVVMSDATMCGVGDVGRTAGTVFVQYDGDAVRTTSAQELRVIELLRPEVCLSGCDGCVFYRGSSCARYTGAHMAMLMSMKPEHRIPSNVYPHCKSGDANTQEECAA